MRFARFFSIDSPKAIKANKYGYLNAISYMAPHETGGVGNLCSHASPGCIALCLGRESGQAAMVSRVTGTNSVRDSRERKARYFMTERQAYMLEMLHHIARACRQARSKRLKLAVRPNGSTDIAYEGLRVMVTPELAATLSRISGHTVPQGAQTIFSAFPNVQFVDYTKNPRRFARQLPANYDLTFSRSETNESDCPKVLAAGRNVAVVFAGAMPKTWNGYRVIDGDEHDLRHLDPKGVVVGLSPKGNKAKRSASGFVVRAHAA
jgi:hypothetical protein